MYFTFRSLKEHLNNIGSNGATMINVNISKFENIEVSIRTDFFNFTAKNIFVKIKNLFRKIRHIDESYGSLLPKLMSVEIEY